MNSNDNTIIITHVHMSRGPCTHVHVAYITAHIYEQWTTCNGHSFNGRVMLQKS